MAAYGGLGVPILGFHNPAATILYPKGLYSYPMGNTRGRDLTENLGTQKDQHLDVLLLASGDVRNLLFTISGLSLRKPNHRPKSISFHLNDYDPSIVARNAVVLEIANTIDPDVKDDVDFLWNVWYNMAVSRAHFDRLQAVFESLIDRDFSDSKSFLKFQASSVLEECQAIWKDWKELELDANSVKEQRKQLRREKSDKIDVTELCHNVVIRIMMAPFEVKDIIDSTSSFFQEIKHWFEEGSTNDEQFTVNPTLIRPFVHKWKVHYTSCPFEGYFPIERKDLIKCGSFTDACKESLQLLVKRFQRFKSAASLEVTSWNDDGLLVCTSGFPRDLKFDIIDTTNVSDHIGLLNVLVCCSTRLKRPLESQIFTSSMLWCSDCDSVVEYYSKCLGVHTYLLPTILGLKLAVDFDLGNRKLPDKINITEEIFCWVKTEKTRTIITLEEGSDVLQAIFILAERCFGLVEVSKGQVYGANLSSPLSLLRILHQLDPVIEGGAPRMLDLLRTKLPKNFEEKFGLSWNLINGSIGHKREPIVEVRVQVDISTVSWYNGTPMPMIVILDEEEIDKHLTHVMTVQCPAIDETSRVIYNSLRYDDSKHVVIFHLLEKDWNAIKDKSWLKIVSNSLDPIICSEPVFLGREGVVSSVVKVDPVEVFGLSFVQTFDVRPKKEDSSALEVIRFEENECSYKAELGIINPADNKSKMNVHFYPAESCPTEVNVKFGDKEGCTMYFSCSVNANSSKFQISRKQGKVWCQMPKREDGTVGESVIQNPATVPFHALERWDTGYQDTVATCGKMFRTKRDLQLKQDRKSGDAFYSLRESIAMVLQKHLKEPEVSTLHCVEDKPLIHEPYQTSGNIMEKKGFGIKVESIYRWNSLPVLKVIFYDCKRFGDIMKKNPNSSESKRMMQSFFQKARFSMAYRILADQKEIDLFRKMLYTNAARVPQEDVGDSVWKASFITLLFPREGDSGFFETGLKLFGDLFRGNPSASIEDAIRATLTSPTRKTEPAPACHFCHKTSVDLKKCMGCKKVSYCSKDCQRNDWKLNHKTVCRRN